jgi:uncharacterized protein YycO
MPIEKKPAVPLNKSFYPPDSIPYQVKDGDSWAIIANRINMKVEDLIFFNFRTRIPMEVNWYLRKNVGCNLPTPNGRNWRFSSSAFPGVIYLPIKKQKINLDPIIIKVRTEDILIPGDIIVSTTNAWISKKIRAITKSPISHSMIFIGYHSVIEAVGDGVRECFLEEALSDATYAIAFRHRYIIESYNSTNHQIKINNIIRFAKSKIGVPYDKAGIVAQLGYKLDKWFLCDIQNLKDCDGKAARINFSLENSEKFYCSELVAKAYEYAGIPLFDKYKQQAIPDDIVKVYAKGTLVYVGQLKP